MMLSWLPRASPPGSTQDSYPFSPSPCLASYFSVLFLPGNMFSRTECSVVGACRKTHRSSRNSGASAAALAAAALGKKHCNCKNSRCLKLYCECFASGGPSCLNVACCADADCSYMPCSCTILCLAIKSIASVYLEACAFF